MEQHSKGYNQFTFILREQGCSSSKTAPLLQHSEQPGQWDHQPFVSIHFCICQKLVLNISVNLNVRSDVQTHT